MPLALLPAVLPAQNPAFEFSITNIMRGPELYSREPQRVRWSADGRTIYLIDMRVGTSKRLTQTVTGESQPTITGDGTGAYFVRDTGRATSSP